MKSVLPIAVAQMTSIDNVEKNLQQMLDLLSPVRGDCDLVCFPENSLYLRLVEGQAIPGLSLSDPVFATLAKEAKSRELNLHLGSVALKKDSKLVNASIFISAEGQVRVAYEKIHLFDIQLQGAAPVRESDVFAYGADTAVLPIEGWKFGQSICYDVRFSELYQRYAKLQCEALLVPSSFLVPTGKAHWHILLRARAIENQAYVIAAAQAGEHTNGTQKRSTYGHSLIIDPWGEILAEGGASGPQLLRAELSSERVASVRRQIPMHGHRRL